MEITKELFESVMEDESIIFISSDIDIKYKYQEDELKTVRRYGINNFFFRVKEWANEYGYEIYSCKESCHLLKDGRLLLEINYKEEQQAVFDCGQRVLEVMK